MKKVITAIGSEILNNKLRMVEDIEVKARDISYKEGILEYLEKDSELDVIIINENLINNELEYYIDKISRYEIQIFLITNKMHYMEEFENYRNIRLLKNENDVLEVFERNLNVDERNFENKIVIRGKRVISVLGNYGVGKTIFCSLLGKVLSQNKKVLLVNFDIFNDNLKYLFGIKDWVKSFEIDSLINEFCKNLYVLNDLKYVFNENNKIDTYKVKQLIDELKKKFDYIILDTSSELTLKYIKTIFPVCDYNVFLLEGNYLEIKKAKELLEIYTLDFNLDIKKTGIFINKYNASSIDVEIIKNIFENFKILGKINYSTKVNSYINTFTKDNIKISAILNFKKYLDSAKIK